MAKILIFRNLSDEGDIFSGRDIIAMGNDDEGIRTYITELPNTFDNDYELVRCLERGFQLLEQNPAVSKSVEKKQASVSMTPKIEEVLKGCHAFSDFIRSAYFLINGNIFRMTLNKNLIKLEFCEERQSLITLIKQGNWIEMLPEFALDYNLAKVKQDLKLFNMLKYPCEHHAVRDRLEKRLKLEDALGNQIRGTDDHTHLN